MRIHKGRYNEDSETDDIYGNQEKVSEHIRKMKRMKRFAIFDLDGTLLDTLEDLKDSMNYILRKEGFSERSLLEIRSFVGNGVRKLVERAVPLEVKNDKDLIDRLYKEFSSYYNEHCMVKTGLYPGISEMIDEIRGQGYECAIVSNKIDSAVKELGEKYFGDRMKSLVGEVPGIPTKPAPDMVLRAMEEMGASPRDSIYIGDSEVDIETAKNVGIPCVSVLWGFRDREFLENKGGTVFVENVKELTEKLLAFKL